MVSLMESIVQPEKKLEVLSRIAATRRLSPWRTPGSSAPSLVRWNPGSLLIVEILGCPFSGIGIMFESPGASASPPCARWAIGDDHTDEQIGVVVSVPKKTVIHSRWTSKHMHACVEKMIFPV